MWVAVFAWEFFLGKTDKIKASSTVELVFNLLNLSRKGDKVVELAKGVTADYKEGKIVVEVEVASQVLPHLEKVEAKIVSGEIDLIKGTDLDKEVLLKAIAFLKAELVK